MRCGKRKIKIGGRVIFCKSMCRFHKERKIARGGRTSKCVAVWYKKGQRNEIIWYVLAFFSSLGVRCCLIEGGRGGGHSSQSTFLLQKQILPVNITATYGLVANIKSSIFALTSSISSSNLRVSSSESHSSTSVPTETRSSEENNVTYQ